MDDQLKQRLELLLHNEFDAYVPSHHDPRARASHAAHLVEELLDDATITCLREGQALPVIVRHNPVVETHLTGTFRGPSLTEDAHVELADRDLEKLPRQAPVKPTRESVEVLVEGPVSSASFPHHYVNAGNLEAGRTFDGRLALTVKLTEDQARHLAGQDKPKLVIGKDTTRQELVAFLESDEVLNEEVLTRLWVKVWRWAKKL